MSGVTSETRPILDQADVADQLKRLTDPAYADGLSEMRDGPNAADIARLVFDQDGDIPDPSGLNMTWAIWGQFLDHDLDLTRAHEAHDAPHEMMMVDGLFMPVMRSLYDHGTGTIDARQQITEITPFVDASNVYGSDTVRAEALRSFEGGKLATGGEAGGLSLMPTNTDGLPNEGETDETGPLFLAGDVRASENPALASIHTVFLNEHNYWAERLAGENPDWTDEQLYQGARAIVETLIQRITYNEYLPKLIGEGALGALSDTDEPVGIYSEFSTAAFRFGHSTVTDHLALTAENGASDGEIEFSTAIFNADPVKAGMVSDILRGISGTRAQEIDTKVVDPLNEFIQMGPDQFAGFSLPALNILRGRDHGTDTYLNVRAQLIGDVDGSEDFDAITSDVSLQEQLRHVYGTADKVDLWVGGLAEDKAEGAAVGTLFQTILIKQFELLRDADPYWHERRTWTDEALKAEVFDTNFADILMRSGGVDHMQRDAFLFSERTGGDDGRDRLHGDEGRDLLIGFGAKDKLYGHEGDDDLFGDAGNDHLFGGDGHDGLSGGDGNDRAFGGTGNDEIAGNAGHDRLWGQEGNDTIEGGAGSDRAWGGDGHDRIGGGDGHDRLMAGAGDDTVDGGAGNDRLYGHDGNDDLSGGAGHDRVKGGEGNDTLSGGDGYDKLFGGAGADQFVFRLGETGHDRVCDFESGVDAIVLEGFGTDFAALDLFLNGKSAVLAFNGDMIVSIRGDLDGFGEDDFILV